MSETTAPCGCDMKGILPPSLHVIEGHPDPGTAAWSLTPPAADQTPATMPLRDLLAAYSDGDERGWDTEFMLLRRDHADRIAQLTTSIREDGITTPILLGNDGRVWDGHHRLCVAHALGLAQVPVIQTPATDSERDEGLRMAREYAAALRPLTIVPRSPLDDILILDDEVTRLTALLAEQAATIERLGQSLTDERDRVIQAIRDQGEWEPDQTDEYGRVELAGYVTIGTRELTALGSQRTEGHRG